MLRRAGRVVVDDYYLDPRVLLQDLQHHDGQVGRLVFGRHVTSALSRISDGLSG
jgi:hypothetical protein